MFKPILVPLDGSSLDERALNYAGAIARSAGVPLHLVRAVAAAAPSQYSRAETLTLAVAQQNAERLDAQAALARAASRLRRLGHVVHTHVRFGQPADVIVETSREQGAQLVVLATRARRGLARWWEGSVADQVARWASAPVLLVRASDNAPLWSANKPPRMLVALDGSSFAESVLEPASTLAGAIDADLVLAHVVTPPSLLDEARGDTSLQVELALAQAYLDNVANTAHRPERVATHVGVGTSLCAAPALEQIAREERADIVALATRGRGGLARLALGSTATAMLERSPVPLLVVPPAATEPQALHPEALAVAGA